MSVTGVLPVIPTPFSGGQFDRESFERWLDHAIASLDGYTLLGSTGEAPSLTVEERMEICELALACTPSEKAVVVGITHTSVDDAIRLARHAQARGAKGVLCAAPFYFVNSPGGLYDFFARIDHALEIDLIVYDNPAATKTLLRPEWVVSWSERLEHLRTVKLTDHDLSKIDYWHAAGLKVLGGDDPILFRFLAAGVDGVMMIAPAIFPESFRAVYDLVEAGNLEAALAIFAREILPFSHVFGIGDEIATTKAILAECGIYSSAELLSPLEPVAPARVELLRMAYELCRAAALERA